MEPQKQEIVQVDPIAYSKQAFQAHAGTGMNATILQMGLMMRQTIALETIAAANAQVIAERDEYRELYEQLRKDKANKERTIKKLRDELKKKSEK